METVAGEPAEVACRIEFQPDGSRVEVPAGTTILDAARRAGIPVDSPCGGEGFCGKCRVVVREGRVEPGATELLSPDQVENGSVLACRATVKADAVIEIPPESRLRGRVAEVEVIGDEPDEMDFPLDPPVKRFTVDVSPPSLENNKSDLERLAHALAAATGTGDYQMGLKVIRRLPGVIRAADHKVTATMAYRICLTELAEIVPGAGSGRSLAVAVDVGTTTLAAHLLDLATGRTLARASKYNSQAAFGADIINRIIWCTERDGGLGQLQGRIADDINQLVAEMAGKLGASLEDILFLTAAGNTTMMHLLLGVDPQWIRREPFVGGTCQPPPFRAAELDLKINPRGLLYCLPCVSSFVGADIVAGVMAAGLDRSEATRMLIDIGTNGEIVIGNRDWMVSASASAGPAFEGAGTRDGMRAMRGAIDHVTGRNADGSFAFSTIEGAPPIGLCGTAFVDLLAELLRCGAMDKTGALQPGHPSGRVRLGQYDVPEFVVAAAGESGAARDIAVTQNDVTNLIRAKGAIYAAEKTLLKSLDMKLSDLDEIMVAGAFGNYLEVDNAVFIGLLPELPAGKVRFVGNTSIAGAIRAALNREEYLRARSIANAMTYFELSTEPSYMEEFTAACFLPHTNVQEFPSAMAELEAGKD